MAWSQRGHLVGVLGPLSGRGQPLLPGPCRANWLYKRKVETPPPTGRELQGIGSQQSPERLNSVGVLDYLVEALRVTRI